MPPSAPPPPAPTSSPAAPGPEVPGPGSSPLVPPRGRTLTPPRGRTLTRSHRRTVMPPRNGHAATLSRGVVSTSWRVARDNCSPLDSLALQIRMLLPSTHACQPHPMPLASCLRLRRRRVGQVHHPRRLARPPVPPRRHQMTAVSLWGGRPRRGGHQGCVAPRPRADLVHRGEGRDRGAHGALRVRQVVDPRVRGRATGLFDGSRRRPRWRHPGARRRRPCVGPGSPRRPPPPGGRPPAGSDGPGERRTPPSHPRREAPG